jgi:hypothetical protein
MNVRQENIMKWGNDAYYIAPVQWLLFTIDQQCAKARRREMVVNEKVIRFSPSFIHLSFFSLSLRLFMYIARPIGFSSPLR